MVGLPLLFQSGLDPHRLAGWAPASIGFALASWYSASSDRRRALALLVFQVACVLAMVLLLCDGFEGALLVLVALQLGGRVSRRIGIVWIVAQSALLAGAIAIHWSPRPALLLVPPYLGFELLAFFVADVLARDASARAVVEENSRLALWPGQLSRRFARSSRSFEIPSASSYLTRCAPSRPRRRVLGSI